MKKILFLLIFSFFLLPNFVFASCSNDGVTVVYINGIFTTKKAANDDLGNMRYQYQKRYSNNVTFITGYNPSHLNGLGDVTKSVMQAYGVSGLDTDLINILQQVHSELSTRKVLLVGHSQGTFYTNLAYDYLIHHGVAPKSIAVYNIATPANHVAGYGGYLTSASDNVINKVVRDLTIQGNAYRPLPANIYLPVTWKEQQDQFGGHDLSSVYLARAPDRILSEMQSEIQWLSSVNTDDSGECFTAPRENMVQKASASLLVIGDKTTSFLVGAGNGIKNATVAVTDAIFYAVADFVDKFVEIASDPNVWIAGVGARTDNLPKTGEATMVAVNLKNPLQYGIFFDQKQDEIDDYLEKLDLQNTKNDVNQDDKPEDVIEDIAKDTVKDAPVVLAKASKGARTIFPKILISEVQTAGATDSKEEFVELYNPNDFEIDLGNWYLQRKTKGASSYTTYVSSNILVGKKIGAHNFLLIARQGYLSGIADVVTDNALTDDNALALKNPNGEISDKLGFGLASDFENLPALNPAPSESIGRTQDEKDTENNSVDFLANVPTPRSVNVAKIPSEPKPPVILKNILINEIQIDGVTGTGGTDDDWVELYNPNDEDVSLAGYSLQKHSKDSPCSLAKSFYHKNFDDSAVIKAHGFFLIVSTKANATLKSIADMTASFALSDDNTIYLVSVKDNLVLGNELTIVDKVGFGINACFSETSPAPSPEEGKSIERKKLGQDTGDNSTDFKVSDEISPKGTFPKTIIEDATNYDANPNIYQSGAPFYNLLIRWQSPSQNVDFYQLQYKLSGGDWQDWLAKTTDTQSYFKAEYSLLNDDVYQFRVRAQDKDGILGDWSKEITVNLENPVVINEVAFAGTDANANDQWIELYNKSDQDIDLSGYKIVSGNGSGQNAKDTINLSLKGTILAKGYFILERTDEDTLPDVLADQLFFPSIGKDYLYLRAPNNRYVDEFFIPSYGLNENDFIKNGNHYAMERVSSMSFGMVAENWKLNTGLVLQNKDRLGNLVFGTPLAINSINGLYTYYRSGFLQNTTLKKEFSPYVFSGKITAIPLGQTLTVNAGVVIKLQDKSSWLQVDGKFDAFGAPEEPVVITSIRDDEYGGDTNGDGWDSLPSPGDWMALYFAPHSTGILNNTKVRFGGAVAGGSPLTWGNTLWIDNARVDINDSVFEKNRNRVVRLSNADTRITKAQFLENNTTDWPFEGQSMGIFIEGGGPEITNSYFEKNDTGIFINDGVDLETGVRIPATPSVENNTFVKNNTPVVLNNSANTLFAGNQATDNSYNAILLPQTISQDLALKPDLPYLVKNVALVRPDVTLTLAPGVVVNFQNDHAGLEVDGTLKAVGLADAPVKFLPYNADASLGSWLGVRFTKTSHDSALENVFLGYAGSRFDNAYGCGIKVEETAISLKNSVISKNAGCGVRLINSLAVVDAVEFSDNTSSNLTSEARALWVQGNAPEIKNSIFKNNYYGIYQEDFKNEATGETVPFAPILQNNQFENNIIDIFPTPATPTP